MGATLTTTSGSGRACLRSQVLAERRVGTDAVRDVSSGAARDAQGPRGGEELDRPLHAARKLSGREEAGQDVDGLDAGDDPCPRLLDLHQLLRVEQEHHVDDDVGLLERLHRRRVPRERRGAHRPDPHLASDAQRRLGQTKLEGCRAEPRGSSQERVRVVRPLVALRDDDEGLCLSDRAQTEFLLAQVDECGAAQDGAILSEEVTITYKFFGIPGRART